MWKEAMRRAKTTEERPKKNISTASMGDKLGRLHLARQDLTNLQTRKMKGLKRPRAVEDGHQEMEDENPSASVTERRTKRGRPAQVEV